MQNTPKNKILNIVTADGGTPTPAPIMTGGAIKTTS